MMQSSVSACTAEDVTHCCMMQSSVSACTAEDVTHCCMMQSSVLVAIMSCSRTNVYHVLISSDNKGQ